MLLIIVKNMIIVLMSKVLILHFRHFFVLDFWSVFRTIGVSCYLFTSPFFLLMDLKTLLKTTPRYISLLALNGISTPKQLLLNFPRTYEDRSTLVPIA
jgi:hypothetical protein